MASVGAQTNGGFGPKLRERKHGAATPLDELDKRLLNLMQGSFPIAPRPYRQVASEAGIDESEVLARVQRLLDERIIRQVTPIFDTRALGYSSMLVAAKADPENPSATVFSMVAAAGPERHAVTFWFSTLANRSATAPTGSPDPSTYPKKRGPVGREQSATRESESSTSGPSPSSGGAVWNIRETLSPVTEGKLGRSRSDAR